MEGSQESNVVIDRNVVGFWFLGLVNNFSFVVFISAAEDLLSGYAGVILLCTILPGLLLKCTVSFWVHRIPYGVRVAIVAISVSMSMVTVALIHSLAAKLLCLVVYSFIGALGEVSFLALTSHYPQSTIGAWSSGTGMAGIAGAGAYYLMRQLLHFSPSATLLLLSVVPLQLIVLFTFVLNRRDSSVQYSTVRPDEIADMESKPSVGSDASSTGSKRKLMSVLILKFILPLAVVYFAEYTINQGVLGTFRPSSFGNFQHSGDQQEKSHRLYTWFQLVYQIGVFVSRSSIQFVKIETPWAMPLLQIVNLIFLTLSAIFPVLPSSAVATAVILWEGLLGGATYVNTFWKLRTRIPIAQREWALALVPVGDALGIAFAAVVSIWLEQFILREQVHV